MIYYTSSIHNNIECNMEYQEVFDILYNVLEIIPKDVIEQIIFKYAVNSNKYIFKYLIPFNTIYDNVRYNKQLSIICCQNDVTIKLIDYKTGCIYEGLLIDTEMYVTYFTNKHVTSEIIYINNILIVRCNEILYKYNYNLDLSRCHYIQINSLVAIYDEHIYIVTEGYMSYSVCKCDMNFNKLYKSVEYIFPFFSKYTQYITIYDDMLYICAINENKLHVTTHNTTDLRRIHDINHELINKDDLLDRTLYKNKLYELYQFNNNIIVYDLITMTHIYTININPEVRRDAKLTIADDILMISDKENTLFYEIQH